MKVQASKQEFDDAVAAYKFGSVGALDRDNPYYMLVAMHLNQHAVHVLKLVSHCPACMYERKRQFTTRRDSDVS